MTAINRDNSILSNGIIQSQDNGHVEIFSDASGITLTGVSGNIDFKDQYVSGYINFSESGEADLQTINGRKSIIGVLNQVGKFYVSAGDTVADYASNKIVGVSGILVNVINDFGDEQLEIGINVSALAESINPYIVHNVLDGLQGGQGGEYYHLTSQQLIDLTSGIFADDQHLHSASAVYVDESQFSYVSGATVQDVLEDIDSKLADFTILVNFDLGGSIRNGNTDLGIDTDTPYVRFNHNNEGIAAFMATVPDSYNGSSIAVKVKWYSEDSDTNNIRWTLAYKGLGAGDLASVASTVLAQTVAEPGAAYEVVETTFTIPAASFLNGEVMNLVLRRLGNNVLDTSNKRSRVIEFSLNY